MLLIAIAIATSHKDETIFISVIPVLIITVEKLKFLIFYISYYRHKIIDLMLIVTFNFRFTVATLAPNSGLLGNSNEEAALVEQWSHFGETEIAAFVGIANALCKGYVTPYNKPV